MNNEEICPGQIWRRFTGQHYIPINFRGKVMVEGKHIADIWETFIIENEIFYNATFLSDLQKRNSTWQRISEQ